MYTKTKHNSLKAAPMIALVLALSMILAACSSATQAVQTQTVSTPGAFQGSGSATSAPSLPTAASTQPAAAASQAEIKVATDAKLGQILVDGKGMTLYAFTKDSADTSVCDAKCLANWPPLLAQGAPKLGSGVDQSLIGTGSLLDGRSIVTYNHLPLYTFVKDKKPGDVNGQEVGSVWYVISPQGKIVESPEAGTPASSSEEGTPTAAPAAAGASEPTINVVTDPKYGQFLVDGKGMTLYMFTRDTADTSNCDAKCLAAWPPLLTQGSPTLGTGVDDSKIGTAMLADGRMIVTYNHMPLYYFAKDKKAGDILGQGVGSVWYLVSPDGEVIKQ